MRCTHALVTCFWHKISHISTIYKILFPLSLTKGPHVSEHATSVPSARLLLCCWALQTGMISLSKYSGRSPLTVPIKALLKNLSALVNIWSPFDNRDIPWLGSEHGKLYIHSQEAMYINSSASTAVEFFFTKPSRRTKNHFIRWYPRVLLILQYSQLPQIINILLPYRHPSTLSMMVLYYQSDNEVCVLRNISCFRYLHCKKCAYGTCRSVVI